MVLNLEGVYLVDLAERFFPSVTFLNDSFFFSKHRLLVGSAAAMADKQVLN